MNTTKSQDTHLQVYTNYQKVSSLFSEVFTNEFVLCIHIIQALSQSSTTASPGAGPPYCRGQYNRGRIVRVVLCPSLGLCGGLSPEWPRPDSICSLAYVDKHFVWSASVVLVLVWFCFQWRAYGRCIPFHRTADFAWLHWGFFLGL